MICLDCDRTTLMASRSAECRKAHRQRYQAEQYGKWLAVVIDARMAQFRAERRRTVIEAERRAS